jgi:acyltransferase
MKDRTILALKGIAIIGVVLHHVGNRRLEADAGYQTQAFVYLFDWCVLAFFCVSGYLQALTDSKKHRSLVEFTRVRFQRLMVPYFLLFLVYACLWQVVQAFHLPGIGGRAAPGFLDKLKDAFWPVDSQVAQQLYFFPLLFAISLLLALLKAAFGLRGIWGAGWLSAVVGLAYFPRYLTGFSWDTFLAGICVYAAGYLMFHYRQQPNAIRIVLLAFTLVAVFFYPQNGIIRCIPLWLLSEGANLKLDRVPLLCGLGEASGTIYVYHTPFIVLPLSIAASYLPGPEAQFIGILLAAAATIAICSAIFELLKNTRAKFLLM